MYPVYRYNNIEKKTMLRYQTIEKSKDCFVNSRYALTPSRPSLINGARAALNLFNEIFYVPLFH